MIPWRTSTHFMFECHVHGTIILDPNVNSFLIQFRVIRQCPVSPQQNPVLYFTESEHHFAIEDQSIDIRTVTNGQRFPVHHRPVTCGENILRLLHRHWSSHLLLHHWSSHRPRWRSSLRSQLRSDSWSLILTSDLAVAIYACMCSYSHRCIRRETTYEQPSV